MRQTSKVKADLHKKTKKQNVFRWDSATPCYCVCMGGIPELRFKHCSPCFAHKLH